MNSDKVMTEELKDCSFKQTFDRMQLCYCWFMRLYQDLTFVVAIEQIKHYYRYGELRDCHRERDDFMFCASLVNKNEQERDVSHLGVI